MKKKSIKNVKNVMFGLKMAKPKKFGRNFFWSESIQNVSKRILN